MSEILVGNAVEVLKEIPADSVDMCVTSPPYYGLRDYGEKGQYGIERKPQEYIDHLTSDCGKRQGIKRQTCKNRQTIV